MRQFMQQMHKAFFWRLYCSPYSVYKFHKMTEMKILWTYKGMCMLAIKIIQCTWNLKSYQNAYVYKNWILVHCTKLRTHLTYMKCYSVSFSRNTDAIMYVTEADSICVSSSLYYWPWYMHNNLVYHYF